MGLSGPLQNSWAVYLRRYQHSEASRAVQAGFGLDRVQCRQGLDWLIFTQQCVANVAVLLGISLPFSF